MNARYLFLASALALMAVLFLTVGISRAQQPVQPPLPGWEDTANSDVSLYIPVQGRLTNASGAPLNGDYTVTFNLYATSSGGTPVCHDTNSVSVQNGLFNSNIGGDCYGRITGQQLYLGIKVASDPEMSPRQPIYAVPYAWSLISPAIISTTTSGDAVLHIENAGANGRGLRSYATSASGVNYGVVGAAKSPTSFGGYFYNSGGGVGLRGDSDTGAAIAATGTGIIQSSATTSLWISGNGLRKYATADSTIVDMDSIGGAMIKRGATAGTKNVVLPITVPGPLYGQNVTVSDLDIYWQGDTSFDAITAVLLRRQTGVCSSSACYAVILNNHSTNTCDASVHATGCTLHFDLSSNNVLTSNSGVLYLTLELTFESDVSWFDIGGVRLTLLHN